MLETPRLVQTFPRLDSADSAVEFKRIRATLSDIEHWQLLRWVWIRHGGSVARLKAQEELLMARRAGKNYLMTDNERLELSKLPDELTVFHGTSMKATEY